ncbi:appetite-regulating hormone [Suncus etruscus]|uniref:appetite-regulating hormone n=1 Tax=Suncus etruscus TaxID=109475 RepID=UPI00211074FE|nr:appetite-regulating hormone [Suncus etruscus]
MRSLVPICCLLLLGALLTDLAMAGSSFLSPEHQKGPKKDPRKPPAKLQPRALGGHSGPGSSQEEPGDELQIRFNAPFDVGLKLSGAQYHQQGQALGQFLQDILWEANDVPADK